MVPDALERKPVAKLFALPNLSHFVNAKAFVNDKKIAIKIKMRYKNSNFNTAKIPKTIHATGWPYKRVQNTFESIGLMYREGSADSNTHTFSNSPVDDSSMKLTSFHHLKPTNKRPATFFKFQKSPDIKRTRTMKCNMNRFFLVMNPIKKFPKM